MVRASPSIGSISMSFATMIQPIWVRGYDMSAPYRIIETIQADPIVYTNDIDHLRVDLPIDHAVSTRGKAVHAS